MGQLRVTIFYFLQVIMYMIFARAMLSWFIRDANNPFMKVLINLTEPILSPVRKLLMRLNIGGNMIDFSPLVALLLIQFISYLVVGIN